MTFLGICSRIPYTKNSFSQNTARDRLRTLAIPQLTRGPGTRETSRHAARTHLLPFQTSHPPPIYRRDRDHHFTPEPRTIRAAQNNDVAIRARSITIGEQCAPYCGVRRPPTADNHTNVVGFLRPSVAPRPRVSRPRRGGAGEGKNGACLSVSAGMPAPVLISGTALRPPTAAVGAECGPLHDSRPINGWSAQLSGSLITSCQRQLRPRV